MPQPFNRIVPNAHIALETKALDDKPDMAVLVCKIFATWASIEQELSFLLVRVLGANAAPALAMYSTLTAQHLQNSALQAAAKAALQQQDHEVFLAAISAAESAQTPRNQLAHWRWGTCKQRPDLLALANPKMIRERDLRVAKHYGSLPADAPLDLRSDIHQFDDSLVLAYSKRTWSEHFRI